MMSWGASYSVTRGASVTGSNRANNARGASGVEDLAGNIPSGGAQP